MMNVCDPNSSPPTAKRTKEIAIACLHLQHGGIEMAVSSLANALCEQGYQVELLCTYQLGEPAYPLDSRVVITYLTDCAPNRREFAQAAASGNPFSILREAWRAVRTLWRKYASMRRAIRGVKTGTILSTRHEYSRLLSRYGRPGVLKIAQLHQDHRFSSRLLRQIARGYRKIDSLVVPTRQSAVEMRAMLAPVLPGLPCFAIPHFLPQLGELSSPDRQKQVIAVGRLHPEKGFLRMLRVWRDVSLRHPDFRLKIVGEGDELSRLRDQCRALDIENSVVFAGALPHEQVLSEMAHSWCYWMTSLEESFGYVLIEAMSCAIPVLAYDVRTGPSEIITDGVNGFLVKDGDECAMAARLDTLLSDRELCAALGREGRETAELYKKEVVLKRWIQLLES